MTIPGLASLCAGGRRLTMLTAYDYPTARLLDQAGVDLLLVGDSLGMVVLGYDSTMPVTLDEMIHHTRPVRRAARRALVVGDLPFGSYQVGERQAIRSSIRLVKEGGAQAVKLEGGVGAAGLVRAIVRAGVSVMGHVGLTPQSLYQMGGYRVQGRTEASIAAVLGDARALEEAGAFCVVLEGIPWQLAARVSEELAVPTIGIGAGPHCDGQVLVIHDLVGLGEGKAPRFVRRYATVGQEIGAAARRFVADVQAGRFPDAGHCYDLASPELRRQFDLDRYSGPLPAEVEGTC